MVFGEGGPSRPYIRLNEPVRADSLFSPPLLSTTAKGPCAILLQSPLLNLQGERRALLIVHPCDRHGAQGVLDGASKLTLENEFGTSNDDEVIIKILEGGEVQASEVCFGFSEHSVVHE